MLLYIYILYSDTVCLCVHLSVYVHNIILTTVNILPQVTDCHNYHRSIIFPSGNQTIAGDTTADQTFIACGTNFLQPSCQYRLVTVQCLWVWLLVM